LKARWGGEKYLPETLQAGENTRFKRYPGSHDPQNLAATEERKKESNQKEERKKSVVKVGADRGKPRE